MVLAKPKLVENSQKPAQIKAVKFTLHPRNKHRQRYDFDALIKTSPALAVCGHQYVRRLIYRFCRP